MAKEKPKDKTAGSRGLHRKEHFENGGTLAQWRGLHQVHTSKNQKRKNRRTEKEKAIREGQDG